MDLKIEPGVKQGTGLPIRISGACPEFPTVTLKSSLSREPVTLGLEKGQGNQCRIELVHYRPETVQLTWGTREISLEFTPLKPLSFAKEFGLFLGGAIPIVVIFALGLFWRKRRNHHDSRA